MIQSIVPSFAYALVETGKMKVRAKQILDILPVQQQSQSYDPLNYGQYLFGPVGIGKSITIAYIVSRLRAEDRSNCNSCRVIYIRDCQKWIQAKENYDAAEAFVLAEIAFAFYDDKKLLETLHFFEVRLAVARREEKKRIYKDALKFVIQHAKRPILFVFDQHNSISKNRDLRTVSPFHFFEDLNAFDDYPIHVLTSGSANNELDYQQIDEVRKVDDYDFLSEIEIRKLLEIYGFTEISDDFLHKFALDTGGLAYEVALAVRDYLVQSFVWR